MNSSNNGENIPITAHLRWAIDRPITPIWICSSHLSHSHTLVLQLVSLLGLQSFPAPTEACIASMVICIRNFNAFGIHCMHLLKHIYSYKWILKTAVDPHPQMVACAIRTCLVFWPFLVLTVLPAWAQ